MKPLTIYTDGSCLGNPGPGGWGVIIQDDGAEVILSGNETNTTNNRMEMTAVIEALKWAKKHHGTERKVKVYSDSSLVVKTASEGWKQKTNKDLWAPFDEVRTDMDIDWNWVKGHANNPLNERCDELAVAEAEKAKKKAKTPGGTAEKSMKVTSHSEGQFYCGSCGTKSDGLLGYMSESDMIRVDCPHCGRYIKFASPSPENMERALERPLVTKEQLKAIQQMAEKKGRQITEKEIKKIKAMTKAEAETMLEAEQTLF